MHADKPRSLLRIEYEEAALHEGWVRYWYEGELVPLPADFQRELDDLRRQLRGMTRRAHEQERRAEEQTRRFEEEQRARLELEQENRALREPLERMRNQRG